MRLTRGWLLFILVLAAVSAGLRLYQLGDWSFHGDELMTLEEAASLHRPFDDSTATQLDRLPRAVPVSYWLLSLGHDTFGRDERGSRVVPALLGTLHVVLVFFGLRRPLGPIPAAATALLVAFWPEHLTRSQENRFYMIATVCATLCMTAGARAVRDRSLWWTLPAGLAGVAAILSHTVQALLFGGLWAAVLLTAWLSRDRRFFRVGIGLAAMSALALGVLVLYVMPLLGGWNAGQSWGYGIGHSVQASVSQIGWPVCLLAIVGLVMTWKADRELAVYWGVWAGLWAAASVVLPMVLTYHPAYVFPFGLGVLVFAGLAAARLFEVLRQQSTATAWAWMGAVCLFNFPSLVSYYADGGRFDYRTPARYVVKEWQEGDRIVTPSPKLLRHYLGEGFEPAALRARDPVGEIERQAVGARRVWIVVPSPRGGKTPPLGDWLGRHCTLQYAVKPRRIDYYENTTEVFLYQPAQQPGVAGR